MIDETIFRVILPVLLVSFVVHRGYYNRKYASAQQETSKPSESSILSTLAGILSLVGLISFLAYIINPAWIGWAAVPFTIWIRWSGVGLAGLGFILLQWAQNTLGRNWSDGPQIVEDHALVTDGPYCRVRHPIYTAFLLILGSTLFISANWLVGLAWAGMTVLETISRIRFEEELMLDHFGDEYRDYRKHTGRLIPHFRIRGKS